jgi:transposase InsO family protein
MGMIARNIFNDLNGFDRVYDYSYRINHMITNKAQKRLEIIGFFNKYGLEATKDAYKMGKTTIYNWRKKYINSNRNITSLNIGSTCPHNTRKRFINEELLKEIKRLRLEVIPNMGKEKIKVYLDKYCIDNNIKTISASKIGRIIKDKNVYATRRKIAHNGRIIENSSIKKKIRKPKNMIINNPGDFVQIDTVVRWDYDVRRYIVTATDVYTKKSFAYSYRNHGSYNTKDFLSKLTNYFPFQIKSIQTDNGSEFHRYFTEYLEKYNITHYWNHKGKPFLNGNIERFNRTIQDEFIDWNISYLEDNDIFNEKLNKWIEFYNNERIHWSINLKTPNQFLNEYLTNLLTLVPNVLN